MSCHFTPRERVPGTRWIGGCVGPRAGLDNMEKWKFLPLLRLELQPLGPPDSRYTDYAISAQ
jgi:hypothetical protein